MKQLNEGKELLKSLLNEQVKKIMQEADAKTIAQQLKGKTVVNPETKKKILASTALSYGKDHPAYKAAKALVKKINPKTDIINKTTHPAEKSEKSANAESELTPRQSYVYGQDEPVTLYTYSPTKETKNLVIGKTTSGKPIYNQHKHASYKNWSKQDYIDALDVFQSLGVKYRNSYASAIKNNDKDTAYKELAKSDYYETINSPLYKSLKKLQNDTNDDIGDRSKQYGIGMGTRD